MTETDPLVDRLHEFGRQPVDPATSSEHLTAMAAVGTGRGRLSTKLKVGLAFGAGLLIGGSGLASAGALPAPAQKVAHSTLSKVGVNVPGGTARFNDPAVCGLDPATQKPFRNHGQYVKAHKGDPAAAESRCGKPLKAGTGADDDPAGNPADPAQGKGNPGVGNGKGNNGNGVGNGGNKNGRPDKAKDRDEEDQTKPAAPAAPSTTAKPAPTTTPTTVAATTTTAAPATTTTVAPTSTTARLSPTSTP
jgi:hypothetical protein